MTQTTLHEIVMPRLSDSMEEGTILQWLKSVGDKVAVGEELVEIETDKANMAFESDVAGTLIEILAEEGETVPLGALIARIGDSRAAVPSSAGAGEPAAGSDAEDVAGAQQPPAQSSAPPAATAIAAAAVASNGHQPRVKASPLARRLASERGLDLGQLRGSGPGGRIVKSDVEAAAASAGGAPAGTPRRAEGAQRPSTVGVAGATGLAAVTPGSAPDTAKGTVTQVELTRLQQVIARRMSESKATAPHFYLTAEVEMTAAVRARAAIKAAAREEEVVPSFNDMVVKAAAIALREHPKANGAYRDGRFELYSRVNVGVAVAAQGALVVPTVFDADCKGLRQIAAETRALAGKVREGTVTPPELSGGTFTVSNLGMYGVEEFGAVVNLPQAGILAVGSIREAPVVREGRIEAASLMKVTLSCDHRILYGAEGAEFLARIRTILEEPVSLAL